MKRPHIGLTVMGLLCPVMVAFVCAQTAPVQATTRPVPVICIAPFDDNTGDKQWMGLASGVSDLLTVAFAEQKGLRLVDRDALAGILKEQEITLRSLAEAGTAARVGKLLGADKIVAGSIMVVDGQPVIIGHVIDVATATIIASKRVTGKVDDLLPLAMQLATELGAAINVEVKPVAPQDYDTNPVANLHFMRGLGLYHAGNFDRAAMEFMICTDLDPGLHAARYWIGACYFKLNEYAHARIELQQFIDRAPRAEEVPEAESMRKECDARITPAKGSLGEQQNKAPGNP